MTLQNSHLPQPSAGDAIDLTIGNDVSVVEFGQPSGGVRWRKLGEILVDEGVLTPEAIEKALSRQQDGNENRLGRILIDERLAPEADVMRCLAIQFGRQFVHVTRDEVTAEALEKLPQEVMREHNVLPLTVADGVLTLAVEDPANVFLFDEIRRRTGLIVRTVVACGSEIKQLVEEIGQSGSSTQVEELIQGMEEDDVEVVETETEELPDLEKVAGESPIIRLANYIIADAVRQGASDIHIEPSETKLRVRYRIDGILFETLTPPAAMHAALVSRIKIMANLDISERRLPQDGRIRAMVHGRVIDLRVSTLPTTAGEKTVIRILDKGNITIGLERLGFTPDNLEIFRRQIQEPHGIILVTGPTGSGKTTTLYSALMELDSSELNISTVEDPVEYRLESVNQVQVIDRIGMSFAAALRSLLRQDPDVIMVGEMRDRETADIALRAALTGHLVLSTLHTNDAPGALTRLVDMGCEPFLVASSVCGILAQRLLRVNCPSCSEAYSPPPELVARLGCAEPERPRTWYRGRGCARCHQTGYSGRVGTFELLVVDDEIRAKVVARASADQIRSLAVAKGMRVLRADSLLKLERGQTTPEEVMRVTTEE